MYNFDALMRAIQKYNAEEIEYVTKVYEFAKKCHAGQFRESGEPYISHPIAVAGILTGTHADRNTLCAGLLHDVIEDCNVTEDEIAERFNPDIAYLVDGVTNLTKSDFKTRSARNLAIKRKIIMGTTKEARIILIKLADRLHNMETLQYKNNKKRQEEKAIETMDFYVPAARYIGTEKFRRRLEDLSFKNLNPDEYEETLLKIDAYVESRKNDLEATKEAIATALSRAGIAFELKTRIKNVYSVYKRLRQGKDIRELHDFIAIKVLLNDIESCYDALGKVCSLYQSCNGTYRDYIDAPKLNMYRSIHNTFFGHNDLRVQTQIRTQEMETTNMNGIASLWDKYKGAASGKMLQELREKFPFFKLIEVIDQLCKSDEEFYKHIMQEVFCEFISVHDSEGNLVRMPVNSTVIDLAYRTDPNIGNKMRAVYINGRLADFGTVLHDGDRISILTEEHAHGPQESWISDSITIQAHTAIRKSLTLRGDKNGVC